MDQHEFRRNPSETNWLSGDGAVISSGGAGSLAPSRSSSTMLTEEKLLVRQLEQERLVLLQRRSQSPPSSSSPSYHPQDERRRPAKEDTFSNGALVSERESERGYQFPVSHAAHDTEDGMGGVISRRGSQGDVLETEHDQNRNHHHALYSARSSLSNMTADDFTSNSADDNNNNGIRYGRNASSSSSNVKTSIAQQRPSDVLRRYDEGQSDDTPPATPEERDAECGTHRSSHHSNYYDDCNDDDGGRRGEERYSIAASSANATPRSQHYDNTSSVASSGYGGGGGGSKYTTSYASRGLQPGSGGYGYSAAAWQSPPHQTQARRDDGGRTIIATANGKPVGGMGAGGAGIPRSKSPSLRNAYYSLLGGGEKRSNNSTQQYPRPSGEHANARGGDGESSGVGYANRSMSSSSGNGNGYAVRRVASNAGGSAHLSPNASMNGGYARNLQLNAMRPPAPHSNANTPAHNMSIASSGAGYATGRRPISPLVGSGGARASRGGSPSLNKIPPRQPMGLGGPQQQRALSPAALILAHRKNGRRSAALGKGKGLTGGGGLDSFSSRLQALMVVRDRVELLANTHRQEEAALREMLRQLIHKSEEEAGRAPTANDATVAIGGGVNRRESGVSRLRSGGGSALQGGSKGNSHLNTSTNTSNAADAGSLTLKEENAQLQDQVKQHEAMHQEAIEKLKEAVAERDKAINLLETFQKEGSRVIESLHASVTKANQENVRMLQQNEALSQENKRQKEMMRRMACYRNDTGGMSNRAEEHARRDGGRSGAKANDPPFDGMNHSKASSAATSVALSLTPREEREEGVANTDSNRDQQRAGDTCADEDDVLDDGVVSEMSESARKEDALDVTRWKDGDAHSGGQRRSFDSNAPQRSSNNNKEEEEEGDGERGERAAEGNNFVSTAFHEEVVRDYQELLQDADTMITELRVQNEELQRSVHELEARIESYRLDIAAEPPQAPSCQKGGEEDTTRDKKANDDGADDDPNQYSSRSSSSVGRSGGARQHSARQYDKKLEAILLKELRAEKQQRLEAEEHAHELTAQHQKHAALLEQRIAHLTRLLYGGGAAIRPSNSVASSSASSPLRTPNLLLTSHSGNNNSSNTLMANQHHTGSIGHISGLSLSGVHQAPSVYSANSSRPLSSRTLHGADDVASTVSGPTTSPGFTPREGVNWSFVFNNRNSSSDNNAQAGAPSQEVKGEGEGVGDGRGEHLDESNTVSPFNEALDGRRSATNRNSSQTPSTFTDVSTAVSSQFDVVVLRSGRRGMAGGRATDTGEPDDEADTTASGARTPLPWQQNAPFLKNKPQSSPTSASLNIPSQQQSGYPLHYQQRRSDAATPCSVGESSSASFFSGEGGDASPNGSPASPSSCDNPFLHQHYLSPFQVRRMHRDQSLAKAGYRGSPSSAAAQKGYCVEEEALQNKVQLNNDADYKHRISQEEFPDGHSDKQIDPHVALFQAKLSTESDSRPVENEMDTKEPPSEVPTGLVKLARANSGDGNESDEGSEIDSSEIDAIAMTVKPLEDTRAGTSSPIPNEGEKDHRVESDRESSDAEAIEDEINAIAGDVF